MNTRKWLDYFINKGEEPKNPTYDPKLSLINEKIFDDMDLTGYSESELAILMEGRKQDAIKKWVMSDQETEDGGWEDAYDMVHPSVAEEVIGYQEQHKYKHLNWLFKQLAAISFENGVNSYETQYNEWLDIQAAHEQWVKNVQQMKKKDINQYKTFKELQDAIGEYVVQPRIDKARAQRRGHPETAHMLDSGQGTVVYEDDRYFVVRPDTKEASCHFGSQTKWCISQHGNTYFSQYTQTEAKVFYFIKDDSKKNEDYNYKMAVQVRSDGGHPVMEMIWDRHDDPTDVQDYGDLASTLHSVFEVPSDRADQIEAAIEQHAETYPPESPLAELEEKINNGDYNVVSTLSGNGVWFNAYFESGDEYPYMSLDASIKIAISYEQASIVNIFDNMDAVDREHAIAEVIEQLQGDGIIHEGLAEDTDIGASKWWWPEYEERFNVTLEKQDAKWTFTIMIDGFQDEERSTFSSDDIQAAEQFIEYMQDEWGTRNESELEEAFEKHILRSISAIAKVSADEFLKLKSLFTSGEHVINDWVHYSVDDEDDEMSELNLFMTFAFPLTEEYIHRIHKAEELTNTQGNKVFVARANSTTAQRRVVSDFASEATGGSKIGYLEKGIYNVYAAAREFAYRQLKLPFGDDYKHEEQSLPETPESLEIRISIHTGNDVLGQGTNIGVGRIVPEAVSLKLDYQIYVPYHQTPHEMQKIYYFFKFVQDNYDQLSSYIRKYAKENLMPGRSFAATSDGATGDKIVPLKEDIQADVYDSLSYLQALNEYLEDL